LGYFSVLIAAGFVGRDIFQKTPNRLSNAISDKRPRCLTRTNQTLSKKFTSMMTG